MAVGDAAFGEIVWRKLEGDSIAGEDADSIAAQLACEVGQDGPLLIQLNAKLPGRELFYDGACDFNAIFFAHLPLLE